MLKTLITSTQVLSLLTTMTISIGAFASAPRCSDVLRNLDPAQVTKTIEDIAQMNLDLDLAKAQGKTNSPALRALLVSYPKKYQDLISALRFQYSEAHIRDLVRLKISELQNQHSKKDHEIEIKRERLKEAMKELRPSHYHLESTIPFDLEFDSAAGSPFRILPDGRLLYPTPEGLHIYDLAKKTDSDLGFSSGAYEVDGYRIIGQVFDSLSIYDLQNSERTLLPLNLKTHPNLAYRKVELSPDKAFVLLTGNSYNSFQASYMELQTGKEIFNQDILPANISELKVLDEKYLLALISGRTLQRIEIATGKVEQSIDLHDFGTATINISSDRKSVAVFTFTRSFALNPYDISTIKLEVTSKNGDSTVLQYQSQSMPGKYPEVIGFNNHSGPRIINVQDLQDVFRFDGKYDLTTNSVLTGRMFSTIVSENKEQVVVVYSPPNSKTFIDLWKIND